VGWMIVKQPNGLFARFSDIVDDFTHGDMTEAEAVELCRDSMGREEARKKVQRAIDDEDRWRPGVKHGDPKGLGRWKDAIKTVRAIHGAKRAREAAAETGGPKPKKRRAGSPEEGSP
jgi:hypothetical protein